MNSRVKSEGIHKHIYSKISKSQMRQSNEKLQAQDLFTQNAATISSDVLASLGNPFASTSGVIC